MHFSCGIVRPPYEAGSCFLQVIRMHFSCGIVRPPYEAGSCFLQVTSGCSHNKCRFCTFYKEAPFSVSPESEIREDLQEIRDSGWKVKRIFLQGADPFSVPAELRQA